MSIKNVIFIAPPAAGKGTMAKKLSEKYNMPHISTGDLLRDAVDDTKRGQLIKETMNNGGIVSLEIVLELLKERIQKDDCNNGYILDGFPRNITQAVEYDKILNELNRDLGCVIYFDVDYETLVKRIVGRVSCKTCGSIYNELIEGKMPKVKGICENCGNVLIKREDDNETTFKSRYETYLKETYPLVDYYRNKNVLYTVDSTIGEENTFKEIENIIRGNI